MDIGTLYQFVNFCLNTYQAGSYSPDEFNQVLAATYLDLLKVKLGLPEDYQFPNKSSSGGVARQEYQNSQIITDDIANFITTVRIPRGTDGYFIRPTDYIRFSGAEYDMITTSNVPGQNPSVEVQYIEPVTDATKKFRKPNTIIPPENKYPIITFEGTGFRILPVNIPAFRLTYVRKPVVPVFGFTTDAENNVIYDPSTSVQLEYLEILHNDYAMMLMKYIE